MSTRRNKLAPLLRRPRRFEILENRRLMTGNSGACPFVEVEVSNDEVEIRGGSGNEAIALQWRNGRSELAVFALDGNTSVGAEGRREHVVNVNGADPVRLKIDLGAGSDLVRLRDYFHVGFFEVEDARIEFENVDIVGEAKIVAETSPMHSHFSRAVDPAVRNWITDSTFAQNFELKGEHGLNLSVADTIFGGDIRVEHWQYGENRLWLEDVAFSGDVEFTTHSGDDQPLWSSYHLDMIRFRGFEVGSRWHDHEMKIKTGKTDGMDGGVTFIQDDSDDWDKIELDVEGDVSQIFWHSAKAVELKIEAKDVAALELTDALINRHDSRLEIDADDIGSLDILESTIGHDHAGSAKGFIGTAEVDIDVANVASDIVIQDSTIRAKVEVNADASRSLLIDNSWISMSSIDVGAPVVNVVASVIYKMDLETTDMDDLVVFRGSHLGDYDVEVDGGGRLLDKTHKAKIDVKLGDGDDVVEFYDNRMTYLRELVVDGQNGNDLWFDGGGNTSTRFNQLRTFLSAKNIREIGMTQSGVLPGRSLDHSGAKVVHVGPTRERVLVAFNEAIDPSSFTADDVVASYADGSLIAIDSVRALPDSQNRAFEVAFAKAAVAGFRLEIGPRVLDEAGNPLNQDGDLLNGEKSDDVFAWEDFRGPAGTKVSHAPGRIRVEFDQPVDPSTFTAIDVRLYDLGYRRVDVKEVRAVSWSGNRYFDLMVDALPKGGYDLYVGPKLTDIYGNRMNQDGDGISGEWKEDYYRHKHVDQTAPSLITATDARPWKGATIVFDEPIDPTTLHAKALQLTHVDTGETVAIDAISMAPRSDGTAYELRFDAQPGGYALKVAPTVADLFGNGLAQSTTVTFRVDLAPTLGKSAAAELKSLANLAELDALVWNDYGRGPQAGDPRLDDQIVDMVVAEGLVNPTPKEKSQSLRGTSDATRDLLADQALDVTNVKSNNLGLALSRPSLKF